MMLLFKKSAKSSKSACSHSFPLQSFYLARQQQKKTMIPEKNLCGFNPSAMQDAFPPPPPLSSLSASEIWGRGGEEEKKTEKAVSGSRKWQDEWGEGELPLKKKSEQSESALSCTVELQWASKVSGQKLKVYYRHFFLLLNVSGGFVEKESWIGSSSLVMTSVEVHCTQTMSECCCWLLPS